MELDLADDKGLLTFETEALYIDMMNDLIDILELERPQTQQVFLLKYQGLSESQIAKVVGITKQAVNKKIQRISHITELLEDVARKSGWRTKDFTFFKPVPGRRDESFDVGDYPGIYGTQKGKKGCHPLPGNI